MPKQKKTNKVISLINMSDDHQDVIVNVGDYIGEYIDMSGNPVLLDEKYECTLAPWQYIILTAIN